MASIRDVKQARKCFHEAVRQARDGHYPGLGMWWLLQAGYWLGLPRVKGSKAVSQRADRELGVRVARRSRKG